MKEQHSIPPQVPYERRGSSKIPVVVGATGTLGRHFTTHLAQTSPVGAVSRSKDALEKLANRYPNVRARPADATNLDQMLEATKNAELVVLTAADLSFADNNPKTEEINGKIVDNIIRAGQKNGFRLLFISSVSVYGSSQRLSPTTETDGANPQNSYGRSKLEGEQKIAESGIPFVTIRPSNIIEYDADVWTHAVLTLLQKGVMLPESIRSMVDIDRVKIPTAIIDILINRVVFDYVVARNVVDLSMRALNNPKAENQIYNATDGRMHADKFFRDHQEFVLGGTYHGAPEIIKRGFLGTGDILLHMMHKPPYALSYILNPSPGYSGQKAKDSLGHTNNISYGKYLDDTKTFVAKYGVQMSKRV